MLLIPLKANTFLNRAQDEEKEQEAVEFTGDPLETIAVYY